MGTAKVRKQDVLSWSEQFCCNEASYKNNQKLKKKIKTKTQNLEDQNVTGNLTAVFTTTKVTTRMIDSFAHPFVREEKTRVSYFSNGLTSCVVQHSRLSL